MDPLLVGGALCPLEEDHFDSRSDHLQDRGLYEVSLQFDGHKMISTAAATLALLAECSPADRDSDSIKEQRSETHPRYGCRNHAEYVQWFALPP